MLQKKLFAQAEAELTRGDLNAAKPLCARLLSQFPNDPACVELNAELYVRSGDGIRALKLFDQLVRLAPKIPRFRLKLAQVLQSHQQHEEAWNVLTAAIAAFPNDFELRLEKAELAWKFGEIERTISQFRAAEQLGELSAPHLILLARALSVISETTSAKEYLRLAVEKYQDSAAMTALGFVFQAEGDFVGAREQFLNAISKNPNDVAAYHGYAQGKKFEADDLDFVRSLQSRLSDEAADHGERMVLEYIAGKALEDLGEFDAAFAHYEAANTFAFEVNLGSRPFARNAHAQLLERTVSYFDHEKLSAAESFPRLAVTPIFVIGMMRSGTSLVEQILSTHSNVAGAGELDFWPDHHLQSFQPSAIPRLRSAYEELLERRSHRAQWVVDKMPQNYQTLGPIHLAFPEAPIIHVRRSPIDTCLSIYTTAYSRSPDFAHDLSTIRFVYERYLTMMDEWRKNLPAGRLIEIDYEDLVLDRERVLRELVDRIGLRWEDALLNHQGNQRLVTTPSVWQVRQPVYDSSIGRWKRFQSHLGPLLDLEPVRAEAQPQVQ